MIPCRTTLVLLIICSNKIKCNAEEGTASPVVELSQGKLRGFKETSTDGKTFYSFMGIPFAQPPVGNLRFEIPIKSEKWNGVLEANKQPSECWQLDFFAMTQGHVAPSGSEDCLYLNVFTPKPSETATNLPVMVYIHGGGFVCGSTQLAPPHSLLNEEVVLVVIQYRVGIFGFLSTEDSSMPGNMGMKDQTMALKWVQENIQSFGGNPDKVTIFGESAGGSSVHLHLLSPHSKGLFAGAIAQSGSAFCSWSTGYQHRSYANEFGDLVGCSLNEDSKAFKQCLKKMDPATLVAATGKLYKWGYAPLALVPRVDGDFLPDEPATLVKTGKYNKVNFIAGLNRDEGAMDAVLCKQNPKFINDLIDDFETMAPYAVRVESEPDAVNLSKVIFDYYLKGKKLEDYPIDEEVEMFGDSMFKICIDMASLLHAQDPDLTLYLYEFNHRGESSITDVFGADDSFPKTYVSHGDDLFYLFPGCPFFPSASKSEADLDLSRKMIKLWTNFATFGNPTPEGSFDFQWNPATADHFEHLSITTHPAMRNYPRKEALDFWSSLDIRINRVLSLQGGMFIKKSKDEL